MSTWHSVGNLGVESAGVTVHGRSSWLISTSVSPRASCDDMFSVAMKARIHQLLCLLAVCGLSYQQTEDHLPEGMCPPSCLCTDIEISCVQANLTAVPKIKFLRVEVINISRNFIAEVKRDDFKGLQRLRILDLSSNALTNVDKEAFRHLNNLTFLMIDRPAFCCLVPPGAFCLASRQVSLTCQPLLENIGLRIVLWVMLALICIGNCVMLPLHIWKKSKRQPRNIIVICLTSAQAITVVYLLIIGVADAVNESSFYLIELEWLEGGLCTAAGVIFVAAFEASVLLVLLLAVERLLVITARDGRTQLTPGATWGCCIAVSLVAIILAVVPALPISYFDNQYYPTTKMCLPTYISATVIPQGWEFATGVFTGLNGCAAVSVGTSYVILVFVGKRHLKLHPEKSPRDLNLSLRLGSVLLVSLCSWLALVVLNIIALAGVDVHSGVHQWVAVLVLPLNAACTPFIYIRATISRSGPTSKNASLRRSQAMRKSRCRSVSDANENDDGASEVNMAGNLSIVVSKQTLRLALDDGLELTVADIHTLMSQISLVIDANQSTPISVSEETIMVEKLEGTEQTMNFTIKLDEAPANGKQAVDKIETLGDPSTDLAAMVSRLMKKFA